MTIDKAIEILTDLLTEGPQFPPTDRRDAVKLGIEALCLVNSARKHVNEIYITRLEGEER